MTSQNSINYDHFIEIKQEPEIIHNNSVIIQNAVFLPEFGQSETLKSEPEEKFCMEIENQNDENFVDTGIIEKGLTNNNSTFLKISSVTQGFNVDDLSESTISKRGRKSKNVESLKVTTKMKPAKNVQKAVKNAAKLDKNLNKIGKNSTKAGGKNKSFEDNIDENIGIFGENHEDSGQIARYTATNAPKSKNPPKKLSKVVTKPSKIGPTAKKSPKITQYFTSDEEQTPTFDDSKIPIQKSQTSPAKSLKKSPRMSTKSQSLQSSFIIDDKNTAQLKLKISRPQKSEESSDNVKKPRQRKQQPQNSSENSTKIKQESSNNPIIKSEPEVPPHFLPNDYQLHLIGYEPKITKKRKEIRLECDHCGKVFKSKYSIIWHMKEHMLTMPFNCKVCGKGFSYERSFKQHELSHAAKVKCEICGKSLKPHAMYYHMKYRHTNEKTHQCPLCPKAFKTKDNIARHMMRHNMEFPCTICGRKFAENSRLQMHLSMHENPEAFFCSICNKSFEHIDRHMKRLHAQKRERNLKCQYCEYASDSKQTLRRHEEMHEKRNEILQSKTRKRKIKLKIIEMKTFECKVCNVVLQTKSGYKSHLRHYHKGKDQVNAILANEVKDESSMESDSFVEIKVEKEEIRVIQ